MLYADRGCYKRAAPVASLAAAVLALIQLIKHVIGARYTSASEALQKNDVRQRAQFSYLTQRYAALSKGTIRYPVSSINLGRWVISNVHLAPTADRWRRGPGNQALHARIAFPGCS